MRVESSQATGSEGRSLSSSHYKMGANGRYGRMTRSSRPFLPPSTVTFGQAAEETSGLAVPDDEEMRR